MSPPVAMSELRGVGDFAPVYKWEMSLDLPAGIAAIAPPDLNLRCESHEMPVRTNNKIEVNLHGHKKLTSGIVGYSNSLTITFTETIDNLISSFFSQWWALCWTPNEGAAIPQVDLEAVLQLTRHDKSDNPIWQYILKGVFPETFDAGGTLDGVTSEHLKPALTINFDDYEEGAPA